MGSFYEAEAHRCLRCLGAPETRGGGDDGDGEVSCFFTIYSFIIFFFFLFLILDDYYC